MMKTISGYEKTNEFNNRASWFAFALDARHLCVFQSVLCFPACTDVNDTL